LQTASDGVNKRINNLLALKISPDNSDGSLLSDDEFKEKKKVLLTEKNKIIKELDQTDLSNPEWGRIGRNGFNFALEALENSKMGY